MAVTIVNVWMRWGEVNPMLVKARIINAKTTVCVGDYPNLFSRAGAQSVISFHSNVSSFSEKIYKV